MKSDKTIFSFLCLTLAVSANAQYHTEQADTLKEVIVTGTNAATNSRYIPYSVVSFTKQEIEATGRTQLLSALSGRIPSLFVTERNTFGFGVSTGGSGGIKMRGVGSAPTSQILMMVDGKPQFSGVYSHPVADNYETDYIDHVEVLRGPGSVLYGSNAMGGAINVITKKEKRDGVHTTISSSYGSYNTWQSAVTNSTRFGGFSSLITMGYDRTDGVPTKKFGTSSKFDFEQYSGYAKLGYEFNRNWNVYGDYSIMKFEGNDPIYAKLKDSNSTDVYHQNILRGEASIILNETFENTDGALRLYYSHGNHKIEDPKAFKSLDNRIGILAYQNYQPWRMTNLTVGFDFDKYSGEIPLSGGKEHKEGSKSTISKKEITEYSPYITASQGILDNLLVMNAGLRISMSDMFSTNIIPQGGVTVNPGCGWNMKASLAKGYRNPSFKELYLYMMANPDLLPEEMTNYELSFGKTFADLLSLELTGYISNGSNLITTVSQKNINTGKFCNKGVEVTASSHVSKDLTIRATYSYLHTDLTDEMRTGAPKHQYYIGADWNFHPKFILNANMRGVSDLTVYNPIKKNVDKMESFALLDLRLTYMPCNMIELFVLGNNITDTKYSINYGYDMPGTTITSGLKVKF